VHTHMHTSKAYAHTQVCIKRGHLPITRSLTIMYVLPSASLCT